MKIKRNLLALSLALVFVSGILIIWRISTNNTPDALAPTAEAQAGRVPNTVQHEGPSHSPTIGNDEKQQRLLRQIDHGYSATIIRKGLLGFFQKYNIPREEQDRLVALLLLRAEAKTKVNKDFLAGRFPSREAADQWYQSVSKRFFDETSKILPSSQLEDYYKSIGQISIRDNLEVADLALSRANASLSLQQRENYIDAIYKNYMNSNIDPHFTLSLPHSSSEVRSYVKLRATADAKALYEVSNQLSPQQIAILKTYQKNQINGLVNRWNAIASQSQTNAAPHQ